MVVILLHHPGQRYYTITLTPGDTMCCELLHTYQALPEEAAGQGTGHPQELTRPTSATGRTPRSLPAQSTAPPTG